MKLYTSELIRRIISSNEHFEEIAIKDSYTWQEITYGEYADKAKQIAIFLKQECDFNKWDTVIGFTRNPIYYSIIVLWALIAWWRFALLDPSMWTESCNKKILKLKPKVWFYDPILLSVPFSDRFMNYFWLPDPYNIMGMRIVSMWRGFLLKKQIKEFEFHNTSDQKEIEYEMRNEKEDAIIVFTWWTTSEPKWVTHSLESLYNMLKEVSEISKNTKVLYADLPQFILLGLMNYKRVIAGRTGFSDKRLIKAIRENNADTIFSPPYRFADILRKKIMIPDCLKYIFFWSAPVYAWFLSKFYEYAKTGINVYSIYWMTEILPIAIIEGNEKIELSKSVKWDILGYPINSISLTIKDDELMVKWKHWLSRYMWDGHDIDWINTWDLAEIIDSWWKKLITMLWRKKDMIIRKEYNIYPTLYEKTINDIPWIKIASLIGIWNEDKQDEEIVLCIETEDDVSWNAKFEKYIMSSISNWKYSIDSFAIPDRIHFTRIPCAWRQKKINKEMLKNNYLNSIWK